MAEGGGDATDDQTTGHEQAIPGLGRNQLALSMTMMCWTKGGCPLDAAHGATCEDSTRLVPTASACL